MCPVVNRLGWNIPWSVRIKVALLLMASVQQCRGEVLSEAGELEALLADRLWPAMRISDSVLETLKPFQYFQQYCRTGVRTTHQGCRRTTNTYDFKSKKKKAWWVLRPSARWGSACFAWCVSSTW